MTEQCQKCKKVDEDRRTLWMCCFYNMDELNLPFDRQEVFYPILGGTQSQNFYTLRVCKDCRAEWMSAIQTWFNDQKPKKESCGSGIFIRRNGAIIEITEEEWNALQPNHNPTKILLDDEC